MGGMNGVSYSLVGLVGVLLASNTALMLAQFRRLRTEMAARFLAVDARFAAVDARFEAMGARFDGVDRRFDGVDRRLDRLDRDVQALIGRVFRQPD